MDPNRVLEHLHGHLGWMSVAAVFHPAIVLRRTNRRAHLAVALSTALLTIVGAMGATLYVPYREQLKQSVFIHAPTVGLLFERKEHLAFGAIVLAWAGAVAYFAAEREKGGVRESLRKLAWRAYVIACALAVMAATLGTWVAIYKTF